MNDSGMNDSAQTLHDQGAPNAGNGGNGQHDGETAKSTAITGASLNGVHAHEVHSNGVSTGGASSVSADRIVDTEGEVKWFDPRKGFGFIVGPREEDVFAHFSAIEGDGFRVLRDGSRVRYDAERSGKGWKATRIVRIEPEIVVTKRPTHARTARR